MLALGFGLLLLLGLLTLLSDLQVVVDIFNRSDEDWSSLVDGSWLDVEDGFHATGGLTTGLFYDEGHWTAFVEETKLCQQRQTKM